MSNTIQRDLKYKRQFSRLADLARENLSTPEFNADYNLDGLRAAQAVCMAAHHDGEEAIADYAIVQCGSFLGHTMVLHLGGRWVTAPEGFNFEAVIEFPNGLVANPFGKVYNIVFFGDECLVEYYQSTVIVAHLDPDNLAYSTRGE
jgi:hypothetical protein